MKRKLNDVALVKMRECLHCSYLVGDLGERAYDCHDDPFCPAQYYQIVVGADIDTFAKRLYQANLKAIEEGLSAELTQVVKDMADLDAEVVRRIHEKARALELSHPT